MLDNYTMGKIEYAVEKLENSEESISELTERIIEGVYEHFENSPDQRRSALANVYLIGKRDGKESEVDRQRWNKRAQFNWVKLFLATNKNGKFSDFESWKKNILYELKQADDSEENGGLI